MEAQSSKPTNGKAVASLVLGIIACVFVFTGAVALVGIVLGIIGLVLGISAKKEAPTGMATAGIVLSIVALGLCALAFLACVACASAFATSFPWAAARTWG